MMVAFTNTEIDYLVVNLFFDVLLPLSYYIYGVKFFRLRYWSYFRHSDKSDHGFPKIIYHILEGVHHAVLFSKKSSL